MFRILDRILVWIMIFFIRIYQFFLSPDKWLPSFWLKGKVCLHTPHCSEYWVQVLRRYWFILWTFKMIERVSQCHPWNNNTYDPAFYKVVFMSGSSIWVPFLKELHQDDRFEVVWVVTSCDKPQNRWMQLCESPIKKCALELWITSIQTPNSINPQKSKEWVDFLSWLSELKPDFLVVISYGKLLPEEVLMVPKIWPINVHWSILPKYRWASPIQSVLLNWEKQTWITTMLISKWMDEWDIIKTQVYDIPYNRTSLDITNQIMNSWPKFFNQSIYEFARGFITNTAQENNLATYCTKIQKQDWRINIFEDDISIVYRKYRAYKIWPKIRFEWNDFFGSCNWKTIIIESLEIAKNDYENMSWPLITSKWELNKAITTLFLKPEWKKAISWEVFKNWYLNC